MNRYNSTHCVIMAGGIGSRFWPMSRQECPKQFIDVLGHDRTMLQDTSDRFEALVSTSNMLVVTGQKFEHLVLQQLPALQPSQVLTEPARRNTAPAIAYAAYRIFHQDPEAVMVVTPSDHYIHANADFRNCIKRAVEYVRSHKVLLTIGITPTYPATGYGYIEMSEEVIQQGIGAIERFKEKPNLEEAEQLLASGKYLWNSGMFVWRVKDIIAAFEEYLPEVAIHFAEIEVYNTPSENEAVARAFLNSPSISIDYGILEKATNVATIKGEFEWSDLGTWSSLQRFLEEHPKQQIQEKKESEEETIFLENSPYTLVRKTSKDKQVIAIGLEDYLVVDMEDVLLIAPKSDEKQLHEYLDKYANKTQSREK